MIWSREGHGLEPRKDATKFVEVGGIDARGRVLGVQAAVGEAQKRLGRDFEVELLDAVDLFERDAVAASGSTPVPLRIGRSDVQGVLVARRLGGEAHEEFEIVEEERARPRAAAWPALVEGLFDVPGVKDVLAESQSHGAPRSRRPSVRGSRCSGRALRASFEQSGEERLVGVEGVGDLGVRRLRVPHVPDGLIELRRRLAVLERVVDAGA